MIWVLCVIGSGSTMTMDLLAAGGVPIRHHAQSRWREDVRIAHLGEIPDEPGSLAVKVHAASALMAMAKGIHPDFVLVMERDPANSRRSLAARGPMPWEQADPDDPDGPHVAREVLRDRAIDRLRAAGIPVMSLPYDQMVENPRPLCEAIAAFLGLPLDIGAMVAVPDPAKRHHVN